MINPCDLISGQISGFFSCSAEPERIRIRMRIRINQASHSHFKAAS